MSLRNVRKVFGDTSLPPPDDNSDDDYEPLYTKNSNKNPYAGLQMSSHSESEHESPDVDAVEIENVDVDDSKKKKKKKKKKQQKKSKDNKKLSLPEDEELDEIDMSVLEVNAILGRPRTPTPPPPESTAKPYELLMMCKSRNLNCENELDRVFGPDEEARNNRRARVPANRRTHRGLIIDKEYNFVKSGLTMSVNRRENGYTYFTFDHGTEYQTVHRAFLFVNSYRVDDGMLRLDESQRHLHVEGLIESTDMCFRLEENQTGNKLLEQCIAYMQHVAHPYFDITDLRVRLEYKFIENRAFHIALLKYMHLLTNRACHRTALEVAKVLLNLDPSDPLAVIFIVDTIALRAREHQWLISIVDHWNQERDAGFLFNIQYSYAMAHFHVNRKKPGGLERADALLKNAIMRFPTVTIKILECASHDSPRLKGHPLFDDAHTSQNLRDLILLFARFSWSRWRQQSVMEWFLRNANELADKYDADPEMRDRCKELANERRNVFQTWPVEVIRHLCIIKPMSNLLVEGAVPRVPRTRPFDPVSPKVTVNRYNYDLEIPSVNVGSSVFYELFSSLSPEYNIGWQNPRADAEED